ncbi:MAG: hypothetical protein CMF58_01990 [Lentimicrobiaceae bacterium]|jgi:C-methyltransferase|nr:hypothetical protein [Lentimicrobiaceae bacterium]MDG1902611.1 methyltransferase [Bacteroidales bacterium]MDG2081820.1 methyltransferase [Bacteroidales bacterium]|tara:strand:+ start:11701 stop:12756 length:1056 start_codon:yes stop_codon:yes gene_type:complete
MLKPIPQSKSISDQIVEMLGLIYGNWQMSVTYVFAELGIADLLDDESKSIDAISSATDCNIDEMTIVLRCAATLGFIESKSKPGKYTLTSFGRLLTSHHPMSQRAAARLNGAPYRYQPWGNLLEFLKTGTGKNISSSHRLGTLNYLSDKPELAKVFHAAMTNLSAGQDDIISAYDFSNAKTIMDIGGGEGTFIRKILNKNPHLNGLLFDLPQAIQSAKKISKDTASKNLSYHEGDFFESIPSNADVFLMKNVIHNWPKDKSVLLLQNVRKAMMDHSTNTSSDKKLLIIEYIISDDDEPNIAKWLDLNFRLLVGGQERTEDQYAELANDAGLRISSVIKTGIGRHIIELKIK